MKHKVFTVVLIMIFGICAYLVTYHIMYEQKYAKSEKFYESVADSYVTVLEAPESENKTTEVATKGADEQTGNEPESNHLGEPEVKVDMDNLKKDYSNVCGYLYCKEVLSYPLVQGKDNEHYLTRDISGNSSVAGSIFFDERNHTKSRRLVLYGHNMKNGTMFGMLRNFREESYAKMHNDFVVYIKDKKYKAKIDTVAVTTAGSFMYDVHEIKYKDLVKWQEKVRNSAIFSLNEEIGENDGTLLLSTCTSASDDERVVILLVVKGLNKTIEENINERWYMLYE